MFEKWAARFWWLRGAVAAFTLVVVSVEGFGLDRVQTLRFIHALVAGWTIITGIIGQYISIILPIKIGTPEINALMLISTILIPWATTYDLNDLTLVRKFFLVVIVITWAILYFVFFNSDKLSQAITLLTIIIPSYPMLKQIIRKYPFYFKGLWHIASFIFMLEILYILGLPIVGDLMAKFSCSMLNDCPIIQ